jgi:hypothetical protein
MATHLGCHSFLEDGQNQFIIIFTARKRGISQRSYLFINYLKQFVERLLLAKQTLLRDEKRLRIRY